MLDALKKTFYAGIGAAVLSKDAVENAISDLVKKGKLSTEDAKSFLEKATTRGEESFAKTKDELAAFAQKLPLVNAARLEALERRVAAVEEKLGIENVSPEKEESVPAEDSPEQPAQ